ncbi:MAG: HAD hydrolase family protein [Candidatus Pacearchaeota archaeon]|jgi:N-acylneuraminate cytidylyltransferase
MKSLYDIQSNELKERLGKIQLVATDFDGVWTDNRVIQNQDGSESIVRSRSDSLAIDLLNESGLYNKKSYIELQGKNPDSLDLVILSRETNPVVSSVAKKISVKCQQSAYKKIDAFEDEIKSRGLEYSQVMFIGNDLNDIECLRRVLGKGIAVAVNDSYPQVVDVADYITRRKGGDGAVREAIELILYAKGKHPYP